MSKKRTKNHSPGQDRPAVPIDQIIATRRLSRSIEAAHQSGALFFLVAHLEPLLEKLQANNEPLTPTKLEELITLAAKTMVDS